ncbi:MAG: NADH:flavin oxidoreductase [Acidimicrobiia bacterium]|nr:NADH:flavin oxidoreductase [Acidimicrobiia bacterium]
MTPDPFAPAELGPITLRNRIIKAATFEGVVPDGLVTDELIDYHRRVVEGGVGLSTVAYLAVSAEGRTHAECIWLRDEAVPGLTRLADAIHDHGAAASAQIGHAGPVANSRSNGSPSIAPSKQFNPLALRMIRAATTTDLTRVTRAYERGAAMIAKSGFDAIEVHLGHNYLLSAFLSRRLNKRTDGWGGSIESRARFPRQVVRAVRAGAGADVAVTVKLNMDDGLPGGLKLDESIEVAQMLEADGVVDALALTGGSSFGNPMYLFRGDAPRDEFAATLPAWARLGFKLGGEKLMPEYPFEEAFFRPMALEVMAAVDIPLILLGGINRRDTIDQAMRDGFAFVAMARALLREPDLVHKLQAGDQDEGLCIHCNRCMPTIYSGTRCVIIDPDPIVVSTPSRSGRVL